MSIMIEISDEEDVEMKTRAVRSKARVYSDENAARRAMRKRKPLRSVSVTVHKNSRSPAKPNRKNHWTDFENLFRISKAMNGPKSCRRVYGKTGITGIIYFWCGYGINGITGIFHF